ncbi:MAG: glycosyltransferase family 39 protein [bacterium]|nr:glycosyltransferase family 39 protein [bacterium]
MSKNKLVIILLLVVALIVRVYRLDQLLGFFYDQGRDGKVIWELMHHGKLFLIGPTTGVEGIFLGPFYYYFVAGAYWLGQSNPVWPAVWLAITNVAGIGLIYLIGKQYFNRSTGLLAATFASLSFYLVLAQRWLANPTPLPFFALIAVWSILEVVHGRAKWWSWLSIGLAIGLGLQFEAASATFFLPATALTLLIFRRQINWHWRWVALGGAAFLATLLPQVIFDFRHQHILWQALQNFLVGEKSFRLEVSSRLSFFFEIFVNKFVPDLRIGKLFAVAVAILSVINFKQLKSKAVSVLLIWWLTPVVGLLFYHGNNGYVWDYYFTGVYPAVVILVAWVLVTATKRNWWSKVTVAILAGIFFFQNVPLMRNYLISGVDGPATIALGNQLQAIDWIYQDYEEREFNVDVYVPPVIPHAYDYLLLWQGTNVHSQLQQAEQVPLLYTLYEVDPPHPERLQAWLARQAGIGQVETEASFGGITVQRRHRIEKP